MLNLNSISESIREMMTTNTDNMLIAFLTPPANELRNDTLRESLRGIVDNAIKEFGNSWESDKKIHDENDCFYINMKVKDDSSYFYLALVVTQNRLQLQYCMVCEDDNIRPDKHQQLREYINEAGCPGSYLDWGEAFWGWCPFGDNEFRANNALHVAALASEAGICPAGASFDLPQLNLMEKVGLACECFERVLRDNGLIGVQD